MKRLWQTSLISLISTVLLFFGVPAHAVGYTLTSNIAYATQSSQQVLDIYKPDGASNAPAVVMIHGGGWDAGNKSNLAYLAQDLATLGFVVFNINYRLAATKPWISEPGDALAAYNWSIAHAATYGASSTRIGIFGFSAGAHLALMTGLRYGPKAIVEWSAPSDMSQLVTEKGCPTVPCTYLQYPGDKVQKYMGWCHLAGCYNSPETGAPPVQECAPDCSGRYGGGSPVTYVDSTDPPVLVAHHLDDVVAPYDQAQRLKDQFTAAGVTFEEYSPTGQSQSHDFSADPVAISLTEDFFARRL